MPEPSNIEAPSTRETTTEEMEEMMEYLQLRIAERKNSTEETREMTDDDVKQSLFEGSTHRFLFLDTIKDSDDGTEYEVGLWNKFIALAVIALQLFSYVVVLLLIAGYVNCLPVDSATIMPSSVPSMVPSMVPSAVPSPSPTEQPTSSPISFPTPGPTPIPTGAPASFPTAPTTPTAGPITTAAPIADTMSPSVSPSVSPSMSPSVSPSATVSPISASVPPTILQDKTDKWVCDADGQIVFAEKYNYILAFVLLLCFLSQDLFEVIVLFRCRGHMAKVTAILIFIEAAFAIAAALFGTILGSPSERLGILDTFLLVVGIIFVHDVDEQIGYWKSVQRRLGKRFPYSETMVWFIFVALAIAMIVGREEYRKLIPNELLEP